MRILVWGINYAPEVTGIAPCNVALCEFLRRTGHDAHMLTTFRYYPEWRKGAGDAGKLYRTDVINGVPVHRCWHYVPSRVSALKRILHEGSFVAASFLRALTLPRADMVVIVSPPLLLGAAGWLLGKLCGVPFVFHVQDLQPDAAVGLGMLKANAFTRLLYRLEAFAYAKAARVSGISHGMLRAFAAKGVPAEKRVYFPNGVQATNGSELPAAGTWRARQGFGAGDFLAVYSGNLGMKQGLEIMPAAARLVRDGRVRIVICGQGAARERLLAEIADHPVPNLHLLPLQDEAAYREMMADTDLCVITQQAGTGQYFFPSKLLSALAFARPVLAVADADSELAHAMAESGCGFQVPTGAPEQLAEALTRAAGLAPAELAALGEAGRRFGGRFTMHTVLGDFLGVLANTRSSAAERPA
jgi:colanic acid biosynthesis glycosyl transferase WcaI